MAMLITSIAIIKQQSTPDGFLLFCKENEIDPENYVEPAEGVCVDKMSLLRCGATAAAVDLSASVKSMLAV